MVLAGEAAGRRRAERHDVPLVARGAAPPDQAGRAALVRAAGARDRAHREPQVEPAHLREASPADDGEGRGLREAARRGLRQRDDRVRGGRGRDRAGRGDDFLELRRRRAPPLGGAARPRVLDGVELPRQRAQAVLQSRGQREGGRRPGREAECRDWADAGDRRRAGGVRL